MTRREREAVQRVNFGVHVDIRRRFHPDPRIPISRGVIHRVAHAGIHVNISGARHEPDFRDRRVDVVVARHVNVSTKDLRLVEVFAGRYLRAHKPEVNFAGARRFVTEVHHREAGQDQTNFRGREVQAVVQGRGGRRGRRVADHDGARRGVGFDRQRRLRSGIRDRAEQIDLVGRDRRVAGSHFEGVDPDKRRGTTAGRGDVQRLHRIGKVHDQVAGHVVHHHVSGRQRAGHVDRGGLVDGQRRGAAQADVTVKGERGVGAQRQAVWLVGGPEAAHRIAEADVPVHVDRGRAPKVEARVVREAQRGDVGVGRAAADRHVTCHCRVPVKGDVRAFGYRQVAGHRHRSVEHDVRRVTYRQVSADRHFPAEAHCRPVGHCQVPIQAHCSPNVHGSSGV